MTEFLYRYRWLIIISCFSLGIISFLFIPRIKVDPEIRNYVPVSLKSRIETDKIEKEFGVEDMVMILFTDSCIADSCDLARISRIDRAVSRLGGVSDRISPFTIGSIKSEEGMMVVKPLIKNLLWEKAGLDSLKKEIQNNRFARGVVFSGDLTAASISATINSSISEKTTINKIDSIIAANPGKASVLKGGLPYIRLNIIKDVSHDAFFIIPVALLLMLLILKVNLESWRSVLMPFSVVVISTAFSLALIPLFGWKLSIITLLVPVILIAVANNFGIYLVARYQEIYRENPEASRRTLVTSLLRSLNMPILFSGLTIIAGVLGLLTHSIIPARHVGILAAAGITMALMMSLLLIPALILAGEARIDTVNRTRHGSRSFENILTWLSGVIIKAPGKILIWSLLIVFIFSFGIFFLRIDTNQENYFSRKHPIRQASQIINSKFGGSQTISVMIRGDIRDPSVMNGIDNLTRKLEDQEGVGNVFSISQVLREMTKAVYSPDEKGYDRIPDSHDAISQLFELYNMSGNPDDFKQLIYLDYTKAQVLLRLSKPENIIIRSVRNKIDELTVGIPGEITVGGYGLIMSDFAASVIRGQVASLLFAVATLFILLSVIFKSFQGGLIGSIPLAASILVLFGFMGFTGIALDAATALLSSVMIGVGIDFTIQYIWNFNLQIRKGLDYPEATSLALKTIGRSIIINAFSVMGGFSALILSGFISIRFFGYLVIISIGSCLIGAIVIIPAFLLKFNPGFIGFETNTFKKDGNRSDINRIKPAPVAGNRASS